MRLNFYVTITFMFIMALPLILVPVSESADVEFLITTGTDYSVSPASGSSYHLTRKVDQSGELVGGSWEPQKPPTHASYYASIFATGFGNIEFTFSEGASTVRKVGDWGKRWYTFGYVPWYQTEENKEVEWFQKVVFPCYRVKAGYSSGDINAPVETSRFYPGTHEKNVTSTIVPKPAILTEQDATFQLSLSKTPVAIRFGGDWREGSRTPITKQIDASWTVTYSDTPVITCAHESCTEIVPTANNHCKTCPEDDGTYKGCGDPYWSCQPEELRHRPAFPCIACGIYFKPCTPNGHEEWVSGPCPASLTINGSTIDCDADPNGYFKCIHLHNYPNGSGSQSGDGGGVGMGQGTSNYLALGGQNGGGTPPSNGGCNTPPSNGGCNTPPPNGGCNTPPPNGGCTTTATACINPICILDTACATYTCIRSIIIGRRADGTAITEPCGELFTKCQNYLMQRGICSGERLTTLRDYHSDLYR